jgi:predicted dehydrogenase
MTKVRWGLIGCGDIARKRVAPALRDAPGSELVAVSRKRADLAGAFAREFGAGLHFADWREMTLSSEVDAIYVATPVDLHAGHSIAAAEAGKHVLCEKPMALTPADCDRMLAACRANGVHLGIAYYRRFYPVLARIRELIASGEIGSPLIAQVNAFERFNPAPEHPRHWLLLPERSGGGPMADFGCHRIEVLTSLFGPAKKARGRCGNLLFRDRAAEDTCTANLEFEDGTWATVTVTHAAMESQDTLDIFGSEGSLHVSSLNSGGLRIRTAEGERTENHPPHANLHQPLIEDFCTAIRAGQSPAVDGECGTAVARILEQIYSHRR